LTARFEKPPHDVPEIFHHRFSAREDAERLGLPIRGVRDYLDDVWGQVRPDQVNVAGLDGVEQHLNNALTVGGRGLYYGPLG
jgi:hypothetical protein